MTEPQWQVCAVCGYVLEKLVSKTGESGWFHGRPAEAKDHVAVPVDASEIQVNQRCDFCDQEPITELLLCTSFVMPFPGIPQHSVGAWAMCAGCAEEVRRDRWSQVITRVRRNPTVARNSSRRQLEQLYGEVREHAVEQVTLQEWDRRATGEGWDVRRDVP